MPRHVDTLQSQARSVELKNRIIKSLVPVQRQVTRKGKTFMQTVYVNPNKGTKPRKPRATDTPQFKAWFKDSKVVDSNGNPRVVYHGTKRDFKEFKSAYGDGLIFFTTNPDFASNWPRRIGGIRAMDESFEPAVKDARELQSKLGKELITDDIIEAIGTPEGNAVYDEIRAQIKSKVKAKFGFESPTDIEEGAGIRVVPTYLSIQKPFDPEKDWADVEPIIRGMPGMEGIIERGAHKEGSWVVYENPTVISALKKMGYDGIYLRESVGEPIETVAVFDPKQIKSATGNAGTFDPDDSDITKSNVQRAAHLEKGKRYNIGEISTKTGLKKVAPDKWVKPSSVVTPKGKKVYHGTSRTFDDFEEGITWFSEDPALASEYAALQTDQRKGSEDTAAQVIPARINVSNPVEVKGGWSSVGKFTVDLYKKAQNAGNDIDTDAARTLRDEIKQHWNRIGLDNSEAKVHEHWYSAGKKGQKLLSQYLESLGFDSIAFEEGGVKTYGVLSGEQIERTLKSNRHWNADLEKADRRNLVQIEIPVTRRGKTFMQKFWVSPSKAKRMLQKRGVKKTGQFANTSGQLLMFDPTDWARRHDEPDITPEKVLERIAKKDASVYDKVRETEERLKRVVQTADRDRVAGIGASSVYTEERARLHEKIIRKLITPEKLQDARPARGASPTIMMLGGRGGSGKSWFNGKVYDPNKTIVLDADWIKEQLPEYEGWNAFEVHEESSDILEKTLAVAQTYRLNVVIDATMKTPKAALDRMKQFRDTGYRVEAHYMHCPRQVSAERAVTRFTSKPGGRYVPVSVVLQNTDNEKTFKLVSAQADDWSFRDSNVPGTPPPKLLAQKSRTKMLLKALEDTSGGGWNPYDFYDFRSPQDPSEQTRRLIDSFWGPMEKAKRMPIGTISRGRKKVAEGKWVPVKKERAKKAYVEEDGQLRLPGMDPKSVNKLLAEFAKREPGNGIEKGIKQVEHLDAILRHGVVCMISAGRNPMNKKDMKLTDAQVKQRYEDMISDFRDRGYVVTRCEGKYQNPEESLMVMAHDADRAEMMEMGEKYKQDSVVFSDKGRGELIYTTGPNKGKAEMAGEGYQVVPDADDFYTKIRLEDGTVVKFTVNLEEIVKALRALRDLMKGRGTKYVRKYWKNGRWNYVYPEAGERKPGGLGDYKVKRNLGGSTGGALHIVTPSGEQKVIKKSTGTGHLKEEYVANRVYRALGVPVPKVKLAEDKDGNLVQAADYVKGTPMGELGDEDRAKAVESLKEGFIADALLGNWDVLGMDEDNILWDGEKAWRVDNGGAMRYRAQGAPKEFGDEVGEIESMRDPSRGAGKRAYSGVTHEEMADQVRKVVAKRDQILSGIQDASLRRTMENRIDNLSQAFGKSQHDIPEGALLKGVDDQWWLLEKGRLIRFFWLGPLQKSQALSKAERAKKYYSPEEVKARGMRWVTIRGARVLLQGTTDGGYVVVGGAGGKLNHLKVDRIQSKEDYQARRKQIEKKGKEETRALTKEEITEQKEQRKAQVSARKQARETYTEQVSNILGITPDEIRSNIKADQMAELEARARQMVENRAAAKTMDEKALEAEIDKQTQKEVQKAVDTQVKNVERAALQTLVEDYMPSDPNAKPELKTLLDDKDKALEILAARKQFRKQIKEIGKEGADIPSDLKIGSVTAADAGENIEEVKREIEDQIETQENMRLYDMVNAQSTSIKKHIDQGAASSLNGLIGDMYGTGATFSQDTIERLGIEAVARAITIKVQQDGKGEVVRKALEEYVSKERKRVVSEAIDEAEKRFGNADELRRMAQGGDDAEAILSAASANGYALKQITAAQRALGTAVGSLRAASHMINALNDPPADVVQVDMGKDLARAREHAKEAGLAKGSYSIRTKKQGRGKRLVMEIPKESLNNFFQNNIEKTDQMDRISQIKQHKMNDGYLPPGVKQSIKLDPAQEAGLKFFMEQDRVLLDFEAGLGKTAVAYAAIAEAMNNKGAKKVLVVTPSATRGDFHRQRETFLDKDMQKQVRQSTANTTKSERRKRHLEQDGVHIVSQDSLREDADILRNAGYDMVVIDEIHEMTAGSGQAGRFKALKELDAVPMKIAMSGTNIKNSKDELYRKVDFIDPGHTLGSMSEFKNRYKGLNQGTGIFQDASNDSFRKEVGQWMYTQKNQLPVENNENTVRVPMTPAQRKSYAASERQYRDEREKKMLGASARRDSRNYAILSNGDAQANGKLDSMVNIMRDKHPGEKAVIHVSQPGKPVIAAMNTAKARLESEFGSGSSATISGDTTPGELTKIKARFNDPGDPLRFIVGTKSLESGHNLQHGGTVSFHLDIPDSQAAMNQRNARVFRKGQAQNTSSYLLSGLNPMDMRGEDMLSTKKKEMAILGNPREVEAMDDSGFIGMLNRYEQEATGGA